MSGLIEELSLEQQLQLIYIGYFGRCGDSAGFGFWLNQNATAQAAGQSSAVALTNIANAFAPQPETLTAYPFLSNLTPDRTDPAFQAQITDLITDVYRNLFARAPDAEGLAYWVNQVVSGEIGLGKAILSIASGALGADAIMLKNKTLAADYFTETTGSAALPVDNALLEFAHAVLSDIDGVAFKDESVQSAQSLTDAYVALVGFSFPPAAESLFG